jgi:uncharacterized protein with von Willebrand factor type A (vWA) domain
VDKKQPAPPFDRRRIAPALVTGADELDLLLYERRREQAPNLWALEEGGEKKLPGATAALADLHYTLWDEEPSVKPVDQVRADRRYWQGLLGQTIQSAAFQELHTSTKGDPLLSFVGTMEAGTNILGLVPGKDSKKLEETAKAQATADELEQEAADAEAQAEAFEQMLADMTAQAEAGGGQANGPSGSGQPQPGQGSGAGLSQVGASPSGQASANGSFGLTAAQAERLASELAKAKAQASEARQLADLAQAEANAKADAHLGVPGSAEAEAKLTELRRLGMGAVAKAAEKVAETAQTIRAWGLEPGELNKMPVPEAMGLLERMKRNADFKAFAKLLGRLQAVAKKKARENDQGESRQVPRQETGRDLSRALPSELAAYAMGGVMRAQMLQRWAQGTLRLRGAETKSKPKGKGPLVVCRDSSGSMEGERKQWATGVHLALASYAKVQKRGFGSIIFDSVVQLAQVFKAGQMGAKELLEIVETHSGGGTAFEPPLKRAQAMIDAGGLEKADIVFITDGECAVGEKFLTEFLAWKTAKGVTVITIIVDDHVSDATVKKFSDRVERASAFTADEAEAKVFAHL